MTGRRNLLSSVALAAIVAIGLAPAPRAAVVQFQGYDSGSGLKCYIGDTPTCLLPVTSGGGGLGAGDASAANQALQLVQATLTNTNLGAVGSGVYAGSGSANINGILKGIYAAVVQPLAGQGGHVWIGDVDQHGAPWSFTSSNFPAAVDTNAGAAGANTIRTVLASGSTVAATESGTWTVQPGNTANTTPWLVKISDGTNAAAIKAASTAPIASDPAVVVSISPNSPLPAASAPPNDIIAGPTSFTSPTNGSVAVVSKGSGSVAVQATGTGAGMSFAFEATVDGTNWFAINAFAQDGSILTTAAANGNWIIPASGYTQVRVRQSAISSGTETYTLNASAGSVQHPVGSQGVSANIAGVGGAPTSRTNPLTTSEAPSTTGGLSSFVLEPAASDNHAVIKNGAGQVYEIVAMNNSATVNYGRLYNAGTGFNGCNSATNLKFEFQIPANTSGAGVVIPIPGGVAFASGISICETGGFGQTDTTNGTAAAISLDVLYK